MCKLESLCCCCGESTEEEKDELLQPGERKPATKLTTHNGLATPDDSLLQVNAIGFSATEIQVEWIQYLDEYHNHPYKIRYRRADKKKPLGGMIKDYKNVRVTSGNSYTLKNLRPDTQHEIGVVDKSLPVEEQEYSTCYAWTMPLVRSGVTKTEKGKQEVMLEASI